MNVGLSLSSSKQVKKRRRDGLDGKSELKRARLVESRDALTTRPEPRTLLDLPIELLVEIFVLSTNSAFPESCKYLYDATFANPHNNNVVDGPPLWLQQLFVRHTNPTTAFAVQKCLRRRFFGAGTLKHFLPELLSTGAIEHISVPLRCILRSSASTRELLLYSELFLNGVTLSEKSRNKALVYLASHEAHVDEDSLFWTSTKAVSFEESSILQAFRSAARKHFFDRSNGMFAFLVRRFGINEQTGYQLYDMAARKRDRVLIMTLQHHGVRPGMDALKLML